VSQKSFHEKMLSLLSFALLIAPTAFAAVDKEKLKAELAKMEDAFCTMAREKGLLAAFEYFAAPDVAFIDTDPRKFRGIEAVRERMGRTTGRQSDVVGAFHRCLR